MDALKAQNPSPLIRRAEPRDAEVLSAIAVRSEAHWGYDDAFMETFRRLYRITEGFIARNQVFLVEADGAVHGFYALSGSELEYLYLEPAEIGKGLGRLLWDHMLAVCRSMGIREIHLVCGPQPKAFYLRMGAEEAGEADSLVTPGRKVSRLTCRIPQGPRP
ncbi:MAG TPA: GNAT family N-acetyltransferase [Holophaga sp.]|nr:GNAT family N-acetyltransferase [Holophaga sp.]HPS66421.1 GNAT family N-acetyltransferase [Holophaga sp.]